MVKKDDFIKRTLYLIQRELSEKLPDETTLNEMIDKAETIIKNMYNGGK
jgi:hypothetical protein